MKDLFKRFEKHFARSVFSMLCLSAVIFALSCNQGKGKNGPQIMVKVGYDAHVKSVEPKEIAVTKGTSITESFLREKLTIVYEDKYEFSKFTYGDAKGVRITDAAPYKIEAEGASVYVSSQEKTDGLLLTELKIGSTSFPKDLITEKMDLGKVAVETVRVEATYAPSSAKLTIKSEKDPQPTNTGDWTLGLGENTLTITLEDEGKAEKKVYTVKAERVDHPIIKKIIVGEEVRERNDISDKMTFSVLSSESDVAIICKAEPENATITYSPDLVGGKLNLAGNKTTLTITVADGAKNATYTVDVNKVVPINQVVDGVLLFGNRNKGKDTVSSEIQRTAIVNGAKNTVVELCGANAVFKAWSNKAEWKTFKVNGKDAKIESPAGEYKSAVTCSVPLGAKGETIPVDVVVDCNDNGSSDKPVTGFRFFIKRMDALADIPLDTLIIGGKNKINYDNQTVFADLQNKDNTLKFLSGEPTLMELQCGYDVIQSIKINGTDAGAIKTKKNAYGDVYYVEHTVTGVQPSGKAMTIEVEPKDKETYATLNWFFFLQYNDKLEALKYDFALNGKDSSILGEEFVRRATGKFADDAEKAKGVPSIDLQGTSCNIKLELEQKAKSVTIDGTAYTPETIALSGGKEKYLVKGFVPITATDYKEIVVTAEPFDTGTYKTTELKFKAKGTKEAEKITPSLAINEVVEFEKEFTDGLVKDEYVTYRVVGAEADVEVVIGLKKYEYEFLCVGGVLFNDKKAEFVEEKGKYVLKQKYHVTKDKGEQCKVEFKSKDGVSKSVTWTFTVQAGGKKPVYPTKDLWLVFSGRGGYHSIGGYTPLDPTFKKKLTEDGFKAEYVFDSDEVNIDVGYRHFKDETKEAKIKEVVFAVAGKTEQTVKPDHKDSKGNDIENPRDEIAKYNVKGLTNVAGYDTTITIKPVDTEKYEDLVLKLKLKPSGKKIPPRLTYYVDGNAVSANNKDAIEVKEDDVVLKVSCQENDIEAVYIAKKGTTIVADANKSVPTQTQANAPWDAEKDVQLTSSTADEEFVVRVVPKDKVKYDNEVDAILKLRLKLSNAMEFSLKSGSKMVDFKGEEWVDGATGKDDGKDKLRYGLKKVSFTAKIKATNGKVKWAYATIDSGTKKLVVIPGPDGGTAQAQEATRDTTNTRIFRATGIKCFEDKPTCIIVWVGEGNYYDAEYKGRYDVWLNRVVMGFDYVEHSGGDDGYSKYPNVYGGLIQIDKSKVKKVKLGDETEDTGTTVGTAKKRVSVMFNAENIALDGEGYTVKDTAGTTATLDKFVEIPVGPDSKIKPYRIWVDVSSLDSASDEVVVKDFVIMKGSKEVFKYKVKIKLK